MKLNRTMLGAAALIGLAAAVLFTGCKNPLVGGSASANQQELSSRALPAFNYTNDWSEKNSNASGAGVSISGSGFSYTADWSGKNIDQGWCYGKGWKSGIPASVDFTLSYTQSQGGCVGIYGWLNSDDASYPYTEFYIVEGSGTVEGCHNNDNDGYFSPNIDAKGFPDKVGTYSMDGAYYTLYKHVRKGKPSPGSNNFTQWIAIRGDGKSVRTQGTVSINNHLSQMASLMGRKILSREDTAPNPKYWTVFTIEGWVSPKQNTPDSNNNNVKQNPDGVGATTNTGKATVTLSETGASKSWQTLGYGTNDDVYALTCNGSTLYVGGSFTSAGGKTLYRMAQYGNGSWSAVGSGTEFDATVDALAYNSSTNALFAGGDFSSPSPYFARYKNSSWGGYGGGTGGMDGSVAALAFTPGKLYAGGTFTSAGGVSVFNVALWDGSGSWKSVGSLGSGKLSPRVLALACDSTGALFASWQYYVPSGHGAYSVNTVSKWNGSSWSDIGTFNDFVSALACSGTTLYAGGGFTSAGGVSASAIASCSTTGTTWSALGSGINAGWVCDLACDSAGALYVGGAFQAAGGVTVNNIAKYSGGYWSALGGGTNAQVNALAFDSNGALYAGGWFTSPGNYIAVYK